MSITPYNGLAIALFRIHLALGVLVAWATSSPGSDFHAGVAAQYSLAYWSVSMFLNATLTSMICYRVVRHGRKVREHLGDEYATSYFAIVAIIVEAASAF